MFIPQYQTEGSACCDLVANIPPDGNGLRQVSLAYRTTELIDCGFSMELKPGYKACISARSGWASKGLIVHNVEDNNSRIKVIVCNVGKEILVIKHGDLVAQMCLSPIYQFQWES